MGGGKVYISARLPSWLPVSSGFVVTAPVVLNIFKNETGKTFFFCPF